jgi:CMP-N,N'-diacetyllegionaminic acid synthase
MTKPNILTLIPARGGSKGVPRKNLRIVGGKPLIQWTIESVKLCKYPMDIYVTTDDDEIAAVSVQLDVGVIRRTVELSGDKTPVIEAVKHALLACEMSQKKRYDCVLLLQPTAPMRTSSDIDNAISIWQDSTAESLVSVYKVEDAHPARMYKIDNARLASIFPEPASSLRQELPDIYHRNGAIYLTSIELIMSSNVLIGSSPIPYVMPKSRSINIDDMQDLLIANYLLLNKRE